MPNALARDAKRRFLVYDTNGEVACQKLATKSGRSSCAFEKWIDDGEPAETAAVLHVFREQRVAAGLDRGGDDQRIAERQLVIFGERPRGPAIPSRAAQAATSIASRALRP